jgi:hypothetical protein
LQSAEHTRRAIILLTDGDDTSSRMKMHDAIERAQKADALIYAIGIGDRYTFNVNEGDLRKIAERPAGAPISHVTKETCATPLRRFSATSASSIWSPIHQATKIATVHTGRSRFRCKSHAEAAKPQAQLPRRLLRQD